MTEEKNINANAEKDKFADEVLTEDKLDNVAGGTGGKYNNSFARKESEENTIFSYLGLTMCTGK